MRQSSRAIPNFPAPTRAREVRVRVKAEFPKFQFFMFLLLVHAFFLSSRPFLPYKLWNHSANTSQHRMVIKEDQNMAILRQKKHVFHHETTKPRNSYE